MPRNRSSNTSVTGSNRSEFISTRSGNDTINAAGGNDWVFSGSGDDVIDAGSGNDLVFGGRGNDSIEGGAGHDKVFGGSGDDTIDGGAGNDLLFGGTGSDNIAGGDGHDRVFGGSGNDTIDGGAGNDMLFGGSGSDSIAGGAGHDRIYGGSGNDTIDGGSGNDLIYGGSGADSIQGGDGSDLIFGGGGDDTIDGGAGRDVVYAGSGNDTLIYTLPDAGTATSCWPDYYNGGSGFDTLRVNLTAAQLADPAVVSELSAYLDALDAGTAPWCVWLPSLNLVVTSIEAAEIYVDGVLTDPRDTGSGDLIAQGDTFDVSEDVTLSGDVAANDTAPAGAVFTLLGPVTDGVLVLNADGTFTFDPNGAFDDLAEGETTTQSFTYQIEDGAASVTATAVITITGTNDAPTVSAAIEATVAEGGTASVDLLQGATDVDTGAVLSVANVAGLVSGLTLSGTNLSVDASDPSFDALAVGETLDLTVTFDVVDEFGASVAQTAEITISGTNDTPVVGGVITRLIDEDAASLSVNLLEGATDIDNGDVLSVANISGLIAGVTVVGDTLVVDPSSPDIQALNFGDSLDITVEYEVVDGNGGTVAQTAIITVTGANDAPTVTAALSAAADEDGAGVSVDLLDGASDIDAGAILSVVNVSGLQAGVTLAGTTLAIDPSDAAFQSLALGESVTITVSYDIQDEELATVSQSVTVTITGTNDAPTVSSNITAGAQKNDASFDLNLLDFAADVDVGTVLSIENVTGLQAGLTLSGTTLTVDPSDAAFAGLGQGDSLTLTVSFDVVDGDGGVVAQTASVTISGSNQGPVVSGPILAAVNEDASGLDIDMLAGASDPDGTAPLAVANVSVLPEGVSLSGTTLSVDPSSDTYQALAIGETLDLVVTYDVVDAFGATASQSVTITIVGANDAPTVTAALTEAAQEDGIAFSVDLLDGASDVDLQSPLSVQNVSSLPGGLVLNGSSIDVDPSDPAFQSLAQGESVLVTVTFDIVDDQGASVAQTLDITVTGTNDAPTVFAALSASASEDGGSVALDLLDGASDLDAGAVLSVNNLSALPEGVTLDGNVLTLDPADVAFQSLALGETQDITVTYDVTDENGASVPQSATITITGTNDAPIVASALTASTAEDAAAFDIDLLSGASDVDTGTTLSVANLSILPAGLTLSGSTLTVDPADAAFQSLALGETLDITVTFDVQDENGASVPQSLNITIEGTNDGPVVSGALSASATEDAAVVTLSLLQGASDVDNGAVLSVINVSALPAGVTLADELLSVDPSDAAFQALAQGETQTITVTYDVVDENGASVAQTAEITITGTNDAPTVAGAVTATFAEDSVAASIDLLAAASDVDNGALLSVANVAGLVSGVTLNGTTLDIDPSDASFQSLNVGQTEIITVTFDVVDENGASVAQTAEITITGTNDAPTVAGALSATTAEDDPAITIDLLDGASDIDNGAVLSVANIDGLADGFSINGTTLEVDPSVAFYQPLALGESLTYTVTFDVVDEHGGSVAQSATVTINGTNDVPVVTGSVNTQYAQTDVAYSLVLDPDLFFDIDTSDTLTLSATLANGDPLPSWLTFDPATGTFSGTPTGAAAQLYRVAVTATDPHGASVTAEFWLGEGDNFLSGTSDANETINSGNTSTDGDILFGGEGTDLLIGLNPSDVYVVSADNDLTVIDENGFGDFDVVLLDGIDPTDVTLERHHPGSSDLVISVNGVPLVLVLNTLDSNGSDQIEQIAFGDGSTLSIAQVRALIVAQQATSGDDIVTGFAASDVIVGGTGNDFLSGGDASDEYIFATGDGQDVVKDSGFSDTDVVRFSDRASTEATFTRVPADPTSVIITFANGDSVLLRNAINGSSTDQIEQVIFDGDGVTLTPADIRALLLEQSLTSGDDIVVGFATAETIEAGTGNDYIDGADGSDTYVFNQGDGQDIVNDTGFGDTDVVVFADYELADAVISREPSFLNDFIIDFGGGDKVVIKNSFAGAANGSIEQIIFQGSGSDEILTIADIRALVVASLKTAGDDFIDVVGSQVDTLDGGAGNDFLSGRDGTDTYIFGTGDGRDVISDQGFGDIDILDLTDFASTEVLVRFEVGSTSNIVLTFATGEEITILNQTSSSGQIEVFEFADVTLSNVDILALANAGSAPGDVFTGDNSANTLSGDGGYDTLNGLNNNDTYVFDAGDQRVDIEDNGNSTGDSVVINGYSSTDATYVIVQGRPLDLRIVFGNGDELTVRNGLSGSFSDVIETFTFNGDGVTLSIAEIRQIMVDVQISAGNDTVLGYFDDETLEGGTGDDNLSGSGGDDLYIYNVGDGADIIDDNGTGNTDVLEINGYDLADATITQVSGTPADILIDFGGGDSIYIIGTLTGAFADQIEQIVFDGPAGPQTLSMQDVRDLLTAAQATGGDDVILGTTSTDTLEGGLGNDFMSGGGGTDTYIYTLGDGNDVIEENGGGGGDELLLNGITSGSVTVSRAIDNPDSAILTFADGSTIRLDNTLQSSFADEVELITFVDEGISWDSQFLRDFILSAEATAGDDDIFGWNTADTLSGGAGDDYLSGDNGTDTYLFEIGDGDDTVFDLGGGGTDVMIFIGRDIADAEFSALFEGSNDLLIEFANGDSVVVRETIPGGFTNRIEEYTFDDGTLTHADMLALL